MSEIMTERIRHAEAIKPHPVEKAADEAEAPRGKQTRQWVTLRGGSMDVRIGPGVLGNLGRDLKTAVGRPHTCLLAATPETSPDLVEDLRRQITGSGFLVKIADLPSGPACCTLDEAAKLFSVLAQSGVTCDDLFCAIGDRYALSLASYVAGAWCGGMSLSQVPLDLAAAIEASVTPRNLDLPDAPRMVGNTGCARFCHADLDLIGWETPSEETLLGRALMVATAVSETAKQFEGLWDRTDKMLEGDCDTFSKQLGETLKSRGKMAASTSVAIRQALGYCQTFVHAMRPMVGDDVPESTLLAEGMRLSARLSYGMGDLSVDDILALDELLERLGLGTMECDVDPDEMIAALKAERFLRTNRFLLSIPKTLGRVRLTTVSDELLAEHVGAWCDAHLPFDDDYEDDED